MLKLLKFKIREFKKGYCCDECGSVFEAGNGLAGLCNDCEKYLCEKCSITIFEDESRNDFLHYCADCFLKLATARTGILIYKPNNKVKGLRKLRVACHDTV